MKDNIFKQFCESIDYNTYNRIQNILGFSSASMDLTSDIMPDHTPFRRGSL